MMLTLPVDLVDFPLLFPLLHLMTQTTLLLAKQLSITHSILISQQPMATILMDLCGVTTNGF